LTFTDTHRVNTSPVKESPHTVKVTDISDWTFITVVIVRRYLQAPNAEYPKLFDAKFDITKPGIGRGYVKEDGKKTIAVLHKIGVDFHSQASEVIVYGRKS
jgi:hypothetical protein